MIHEKKPKNKRIFVYFIAQQKTAAFFIRATEERYVYSVLCYLRLT